MNSPCLAARFSTVDESVKRVARAICPLPLRERVKSARSALAEGPAAAAHPTLASLRAATLPLQGRGKASAFSRRASRPSFAARTKATDVSPPNKKGRRSAGRRKRNWPHHTNRCRHLSALRARRAPRTIRLREPPASGALAFRRSTAALAEVSRPRLSTSGQVSWDAACSGRYPRFLSQSSGSTPRTGRNTGGHDARSRPGAVCETARGNRTRSTFRIASRKRPC